jgi:hypothetical protein
MLGLALDVASRLEEKIQLSCEVFINKAEVSHAYKTVRRGRGEEPQQEDLEETFAHCIPLNAFIYKEILAGIKFVIIQGEV